MIHILLATYNGEKFLGKQIESIINQKEKDWILHIRDDCSNDGTLGIIKRFKILFPERIFYSVNEKNIGACATFSLLFKEVREQGYYMFCDQDDIWDLDKLAVMLHTLKSVEDKNKKAVLVYSDVRIIDEYDRKISDSFIRSSGLYLPAKKQMEHLLLYNFVQGSAMMWNYSLHKIIKEIPKQALMHDWWLALAAAGHGKIVFINQILSSYRQHSWNVLGAFNRREWHKSFIKEICSLNGRKICQNNRMLQRERICQAEAYLRYFRDKRVDLFLSIMSDKRHFRRAFCAINNGYIFLSKKYSLKFYIL